VDFSGCVRVLGRWVVCRVSLVCCNGFPSGKLSWGAIPACRAMRGSGSRLLGDVGVDWCALMSGLVSELAGLLAAAAYWAHRIFVARLGDALILLVLCRHLVQLIGGWALSLGKLPLMGLSGWHVSGPLPCIYEVGRVFVYWPCCLCSLEGRYRRRTR